MKNEIIFKINIIKDIKTDNEEILFNLEKGKLVDGGKYHAYLITEIHESFKKNRNSEYEK
jgi:hypothetical protein